MVNDGSKTGAKQWGGVWEYLYLFTLDSFFHCQSSRFSFLTTEREGLLAHVIMLLVILPGGIIHTTYLLILYLLVYIVTHAELHVCALCLLYAIYVVLPCTACACFRVSHIPLDIHYFFCLSFYFLRCVPDTVCAAVMRQNKRWGIFFGLVYLLVQFWRLLEI